MVADQCKKSGLHQIFKMFILYSVTKASDKNSPTVTKDTIVYYYISSATEDIRVITEFVIQ